MTDSSQPKDSIHVVYNTDRVVLTIQAIMSMPIFVVVVVAAAAAAENDALQLHQNYSGDEVISN